MTRYRVELDRSAQKDMRRIKDVRLRSALEKAILALGGDPRPFGSLKLVGEVDQWRLRVGDWRIVYRIEDGRLVVLVVTLAPRGGVYR